MITKIKTDRGFDTFWEGTWLGGHIYAPNTTQGFHGVLFMWLEKILNEIDPLVPKDILLSSENITTRKWFQTRYNFKHNFISTDIRGNVDIKCDMTKETYNFNNKFDIILSQAQLEHLVRPDIFLLNCLNLLKENGSLILMTQGTKFEYHGFPRNYMHFFKDYFEDIRISNNQDELKLYDYVQESKTKETSIICAIFGKEQKLKEKS